jgi:hypothetical protein
MHRGNQFMITPSHADEKLEYSDMTVQATLMPSKPTGRHKPTIIYKYAIDKLFGRDLAFRGYDCPLCRKLVA